MSFIEDLEYIWMKRCVSFLTTWVSAATVRVFLRPEQTWADQWEESMNSIDQSEESIYLTHVSGQSDGEASVEEHEGQSRQFIDCPKNWNIFKPE